MDKETDAVVIGAGSFGSSIAYHLAKLGKRVTLIDKHDLVSQTSPRAAGLTQQVGSDPAMNYIAKRSVEKIEHFTEETGHELEYYQSGSLILTQNPNFVDMIHEIAARGKELGVETKLISPDEARELAPFLQPDSALAIEYTPSDLYLEAADLPLAYIRAARDAGAITLPGTEVADIITENGSVDHVVTSEGKIHTPIVVDAAGAWTKSIAEAAQLYIPLVPTRHQLYITEPIEGVTSDQSIVRDIEANVYVRPARGGLMLGGYEPDPLQVDTSDLPSNFHMEHLPLDFAPLRKLTEAVITELPVLQNAKVAEHRGGLPTMTADGRFIIDRVTSVDGFFVASGCCVGGLSTSPAVGEILASWIVHGQAPVDMSPFSLSRFESNFNDEEQLRAACLKTYANHYSVSHR